MVRLSFEVELAFDSRVVSESKKKNKRLEDDHDTFIW